MKSVGTSVLLFLFTVVEYRQVLIVSSLMHLKDL
jgi:hypothetical protein